MLRQSLRGDEETRTLNPLDAIEVRYQLRHIPKVRTVAHRGPASQGGGVCRQTVRGVQPPGGWEVGVLAEGECEATAPRPTLPDWSRFPGAGVCRELMRVPQTLYRHTVWCATPG